MRLKALINGTVNTMTGTLYERGTLLIEDGKIVAVGGRLSIPDGAEIIDAEGMHVLPGLIDAHTHMGLEEEGAGSEYSDLNEKTDPITPHLRAWDSVSMADRGIGEALEAGITSAFITPGSANVIGGQGFAARTWGRTVDEMLYRHEGTGDVIAALKVALGENPKRVYGPKRTPTTRMGIAALLRDALVRGENYMRKKEKEGENVDTDLRMEVMEQVLRRRMLVRIHMHRADDILTALRIVEEFKLKAVLDHATEAHLLVREIREAGIPVVVGPTFITREKVELKGVTFRTPGILAEAGIKVAIVSDHPATPNKYLNIYAGLSVREGMKEEDALKAITINAAKILGIDHLVGSLEVGKDADLALFDRHPLHLYARNMMTIVKGEIVYDARKTKPAP